MLKYVCNVHPKNVIKTPKGCILHHSRMHHGEGPFNLSLYEGNGISESDTVAAEPVSEPVPESATPPVPAPTPVPVVSAPTVPQTMYTKIPPGSIISVTTTPETGPVWRYNKEEQKWDFVNSVDSVEMKVLDRIVDKEGWMLICTPREAAAQWSVWEKMVLSGHFRLISVPENTPVLDQTFCPEFEPVEMVDPEAEKKAKVEALRSTLKQYGVLSKDACTANKSFAKLKKVSYEEVLGCVQTCGLLNDDEKSKSVESRLLYEEGFKFEAYLTNSQIVTDWKDELVGWLAANAVDNPSYTRALQTTLNLAELKKLVDDGFITPEIVKQFSTEKVVDGQWRLRVDKDDTQKQ